MAAVEYEYFGTSVAMEANVAIVGAPERLPSSPGAAYIFGYDGTSWFEAQKLVASDGDVGDQFGGAVAIDGSTTVIGASRDDAGSAYVFRLEGSSWVERQKLLPDQVTGSLGFGNAAAIAGDTILIGAPYDDGISNFTGAAYVFRFDGSSWVREQKLFASDGHDSQYFGWSAAVADDTIVVGTLTTSWSAPDSGAVYVFRFDGSRWLEEQKLVAGERLHGNAFGASVAIARETVLVGAPHADGNPINSGAAYVFEFDGSTWQKTVRIDPSDAANADSIGHSVCLAGDIAIIGAPRHTHENGTSGSAYAYRFDGTSWTLDSELVPTNGAEHTRLAASVAIEGNFAVLGANGDDENGENAGAAYVFSGPDPRHWPDRQKLLAEDGEPGDAFGSSVGIAGDAILVGAALDDDRGTNSGSAYAFRFDGTRWEQEQKLIPADGAPDDGFGTRVAIHGNTALVGSPYDDDNGDASGSAYVFRFSGTSWEQQQKLLPLDGSTADLFGDALAFFGDTAVIGAPADDDYGDESGSAYVFRFNGMSWEQEQKLLPLDGAAGDHFGRAVGVFEGIVVIGAPHDDDYGESSGSAYVFRFDGAMWLQEQKLTSVIQEPDGEFGHSVALANDTVAIGAPLEDTQTWDHGAVHVFAFEDLRWVLKDRVWPHTGWHPDAFGTSVGIFGDTIAIGAPDNDKDAIDAGAAYIFANWRCRPANGDMNCDGATNGADIDPFFLALGDPAAYAIAFPNCDPLNGDMNGDGRLDGGDIDPFFACLGGGGCR